MTLHDDDFFDEEDAEVLRFDSFDDAVECCADLNIPLFVDVGNKKLVFWFVRVDDEGYPEIARCTEREFATILAGISAGGMYCPECGAYFHERRSLNNFHRDRVITFEQIAE
ncbi:transposase [Escherichia coli]|nr:transposase [Escherichia coli]